MSRRSVCVLPVMEGLERRVFLSSGLFFGPEVRYAGPERSSLLKAIDLNGDLALDLVVANNGGGSVSVFLNNGDGTLLDAVDYPTAAGAFGVEAADFDGDGDSDVAVSCFAGEAVMIFKNDGNGALTQSVSYGAPEGARWLAAADFDDDGDVDLALASSDSVRGSVSFYRNRGDGVFGARVQYDAGDEPFSLVAADFDRDGDVDLVASNWSSHVIQFMGNYGDGTFWKGSSSGVGGSFPRGIAAGDWNRDGWVDLAAGLQDGFSLVRNTGTNFVFEGSRRSTHISGVAIGDLNGDSYPEILGGHYYDETIGVLDNLGGAFFEAPTIYDTAGNPMYMITADLNSDGQPEIIATIEQGGISVFENQTLTDPFPLWIIGTDGADDVQVSVEGAYVTWDLNGVRSRRLASTISQVVIQARHGDDVVRVLGEFPTHVEGDDGNDTISGGSGPDLIYGGGGDDSLSGNAGVDTIYGNLGDDLIAGGLSRDSILSGLGNDTVTAGDGPDTVFGGDGMDLLRGGKGADYIEGKGKPDTIYGGSENDSIYGQAGSDVVFGEHGDDMLYLTDGLVFTDVAFGGDGSDSASQDSNDLLTDVELALLA